MLFRDLKAYQHARRLSMLSRPLINRLPVSEGDLADQWRRACNSVALNLAEGVSRRGSKEFRRFTDSARGSLVEVEAVLDLVQHLGLFQTTELDEVVAARERMRPNGLWIAEETLDSGDYRLTAGDHGCVCCACCVS